MDRFLVFYFIIPTSLGVAISLVGMILLVIDARRRKQSDNTETTDWQITGGKVVEIHMEKCETLPGGKSPVVGYSYSVDEKKFEGKLSFAEDCDQADAAALDGFLERYPMNAYVQVKYDPNNPGASTLDQKNQSSNRLRVIGLVCTYLGIGACCFTGFMAFLILGNVM